MDFFLQVVIFVGLSALYSGLNISFMSLSKSDLRRKAKLGDKDAIKLLPFRENGHLTLASILFANVAAVSANALVLESYFNGIVAGVVSTILMVIFGEVLPQAIFLKAALRICAFFTPLLWLTVVVTYPLSKPVQLLLDKLVGAEGNLLHSRAELDMLVGEHIADDASELDEDEVEIVRSALQLSEKTVYSIMKPIKSVYWLKNTDILDAKTVDTIKSNGYSRVPVFDRKLTTCYGVLLMKDMVDVDFDTYPRPVSEFILHETEEIGSRTALDTTFRKFTSLKTHLAPVTKSKKIVGIVTAEDLIEEIIGHEIHDETDRLRKIKSKMKKRS